MKTLLFLCAIGLTTKCDPPEPPKPPPVVVTPDCAAVCKRFTELGCKEARATDGGASCLDVCANNTVGEIIIWTHEYLSCAANIQSCDEVLACKVF